MRQFLDELRRRNVFRVALTYLVVAWLLIQVSNNITDPLNLPAWFPALIIVLVGLGFPVALIVAWAYELTPEGITRESSTTDTEKPIPIFGRKWDFVIIAGLVLALGYFAWERQGTGPGEPPTAAGAATTTLAVLPFANLSADPEQEYFADGITEELLNSLARIQDLKVAGRTSSFYFKNKNVDLKTIGEKLGVKHILEGSVRRAGDRIRITAQLINAETGYHMWSDTYDRTLEDIFAIQSEIARAVAEALSIRLGVGELGRRAGMTRNVAAYEAYLKGRVTRFGPEATRNSIDNLERAVQLDSDFALAWADLAWAYHFNAYYDELANVREWRTKRDEAIKRARELAPEAPAVLVISAIAARSRGEWLEADRLYRKGLGLYDDIDLTMNFGRFLLSAGKTEEAIGYLEKARRKEPLWSSIPMPLGTAYVSNGQLQAALDEFDRGDQIGDPQGALRGAAAVTALAMNDRSEINRWLEMVIETDPVGRPINKAMSERLDKPEAAMAELRNLYDDPANTVPLRRLIIAYWASYFGDTELALTALDEAVFVGGRNIALFSLWHPLLAEVRKQPGFKSIVRDLGLVDYWRKTGWGDFCRPVSENDFECE